MPLLTSLLFLIVLARILGRLFARAGLPTIVGEIFAGIILGPSLLDVIQVNPALTGMSELAVLLVVLSAGLEMNFQDVMGVLKGRGMIVALLGFIIPFAGGVLVGLLYDLDAMRTIFLGLCVSITALPVALRILESFQLLNTDIAKYSVATAIINDVLALLALGVILDLPQERSFLVIAKSIGLTSGKLIVLGILILGFNQFLNYVQKKGVAIEKVPEKLVEIFGSEALFGIVLLFVLVFGSISEWLGFHFVIGAFFGALLLSKEFFIASRYSELERTLSSVTNGFLGPVFFAYIGLVFNFREIKSIEFLTVMILISIGTKILAGWLGGRLIGVSNVNALGVGVIINARGIMELVIASIAYQKGFIGSGLFSALVIMGVVTTIITPILMKKYVLPKIERGQLASRA